VIQTTHTDKKVSLVPELRFKEFDGEWTVRKMGELGIFKGGGTPNTHIQEFWEGDIPWISSSDISEDNIHNINIHRFLNRDAINKSATKLIPQNSVLLISRVGVGKLAINKQELCTSQDFSNFLPTECESYFIGYFLLARKNILLGFEQGTSIKGFTTNDIKTLKVNIPSLPEQQKIASFLSAVDEKIRQLTRKKELLEQYKKGVMQGLFRQDHGLKGLNDGTDLPKSKFESFSYPRPLRFKRDDGSDFPDWEEKRLGEVLTIGSGRDYKHLKNGDVPVFGTGGYMLSVNEKLYSGETVFIGRKGTINKPFYFNGEFWTVDTLFYTYNFQDSIPKFIFAIFQQLNWKLYNEASGVPSLSKSTIEKIKFDFPCVAEQQKIADYLSAIDRKIESVNNQITHTQTFKKGLLQKMFV